MRVVLFDIDGTLLWTNGAGRRAIHAALGEVFGTAGESASYWFDGKTDRQIVRDLMRGAGFSDAHIDERMELLLETYLGYLERELCSPDLSTRLLPGVNELLSVLEVRDDVLVGLLTGNLERGAAAKLRRSGLDPRRFVLGAYGSDHEHRSELPAIALSRACTHLGCTVAGSAVVVIGDTPADIHCGRGVGARAIGVATGRYSTAQLAEHGPAAVFENLSDTEAVLGAILNA